MKQQQKNQGGLYAVSDTVKSNIIELFKNHLNKGAHFYTFKSPGNLFQLSSQVGTLMSKLHKGHLNVHLSKAILKLGSTKIQPFFSVTDDP